MTLPGETEAGSAGMQPCPGIAWRRLIEDDGGGRPDLPSSVSSIGFDRSPQALKIPAAKRRNSTQTASVHSPFHAEPEQFSLGYPYFEYHFSILDSCRGRPPQQLIHAVDLPLYPVGEAAIEDLLSTRLGGYAAYNGDLFAVAPDYRARISEVRLSAAGLGARVQSVGASPDDLILKLYYQSRDGSVSHADLRPDEGSVVYQAHEFPRRFIIALLSRSHRDLIDQWYFDAGYPYSTAGLVIETSGEEIQNLVLAGESDTVEFKRELPKPPELAVAIAAFLNRQGGRILVGVDDDGQIIGCSVERLSERLTNILRDYCDPPADVDIQEVTVQEKRVILIQVSEGRDKPYCVKDKGVYVRSGATNRIATRYELDRIYEERRGALRFGQ